MSTSGALLILCQCKQVPTQLDLQTQPQGSAYQPPRQQHDEATLAMNGEPTQLQPDQAAQQESQADSLPLPMQVDRRPDDVSVLESEDEQHSNEGSESEQQEGGSAEAAPELMLEDTQERENTNEEEPNPAGGFAQMQHDTYDEFAGIE